jgi:hypothetical protein
VFHTEPFAGMPVYLLQEARGTVDQCIAGTDSGFSPWKPGDTGMVPVHPIKIDSFVEFEPVGKAVTEFNEFAIIKG